VLSTLNVKLLPKPTASISTISSVQPQPPAPGIAVVENEEYSLPAENEEDELDNELLDDLQAERDDDWPQIGPFFYILSIPSWTVQYQDQLARWFNDM
jgi:hypothetical protein